MNGVRFTLVPGECLPQLLELRNEYRAANRGELPVVIVSPADYERLCSEYPVRNYGGIVHGMRMCVEVDTWPKEIKGEWVEPQLEHIPIPNAFHRKKAGRPAKARK